VLIGELARRLGVSVRAVRHYETVGLLRPAGVDPRTGYRRYTSAELVRGVRIQQLKAAGLPLAAIRAVLDDHDDGAEVLRRRRDELRREIDARRHQADVLDALVAGGIGVSAPLIVTVEDRPVVSTVVTTPVEDLSSCIRSHVQRLRRRLGRDAGWTFAARFPLEPVAVVDVEIAASGPALDGPTATWPGGDVVRVQVVGPHSLLPLAHDAARAAAATDGRVPSGTVQETYVALGPLLRTAVDVPLAPRAATGAEMVDPAGPRPQR
jgi:DNA-binding transcriptional MerR regulator